MKRWLAALLLLPGAVWGEPVRIHDLETGELAALRERYDFWGADWRAGYAVFDLDAGQRSKLERERVLLGK